MSEKILKDFGKQVRTIRKTKGVSQEELAHLANLDRSYVGGIERAERNPSLKNIGKIARALKVKPRDLFDS